MKIKRLLSVVGLFLMVVFTGQVGAYDEVQLKKLKALASCPSCDLSESNLTDANLTGADLTGADLRGAILNEADLTTANLTDANFTDAVMKKAIIEKAIFCRTQTPWGVDNSGC